MDIGKPLVAAHRRSVLDGPLADRAGDDELAQAAGEVVAPADLPVPALVAEASA